MTNSINTGLFSKNRLAVDYRDLVRRLNLRLRYGFTDAITSLLPRHKGVVLTRTACLGNEITRRMNVGRQLNHQKNRIDICLHQFETQGTISSSILRRKDVYSLITQQAFDFFSYKNVKLIVVDSYSELTDQLFVTGAGRYFCANYSDVDIVELKKTGGKCLGLMDEDSIECRYEEFFDQVFRAYQVPVIFLHFPTALDQRRIFKQRATTIQRCISRLETVHPQLFSFALPDEYVLPGEGDFFPYHFGDTTYKQFAQMIKQLNLITT